MGGGVFLYDQRMTGTMANVTDGNDGPKISRNHTHTHMRRKTDGEIGPFFSPTLPPNPAIRHDRRRNESHLFSTTATFSTTSPLCSDGTPTGEQGFQDFRIYTAHIHHLMLGGFFFYFCWLLLSSIACWPAWLADQASRPPTRGLGREFRMADGNTATTTTSTGRLQQRT